MHSGVKVFLLVTLLLGACAGGSPAMPVLPDDSGVPQTLSLSRLKNTDYVLTDAGVRSELSAAGRSFHVRLYEGQYRFPAGARLEHYDRVTADVPHIVYGDLNGDGVPEAVVPLLIGESEDTVLELAALSASGSQPFHFASFPLGKAVLKNLAVTNGKIRVNFTHMVPGDPGPRNTELMLELPEGAYR